MFRHEWSQIFRSPQTVPNVRSWGNSGALPSRFVGAVIDRSSLSQSLSDTSLLVVYCNSQQIEEAILLIHIPLIYYTHIVLWIYRVNFLASYNDQNLHNLKYPLSMPYLIWPGLRDHDWIPYTYALLNWRAHMCCVKFKNPIFKNWVLFQELLER